MIRFRIDERSTENPICSRCFDPCTDQSMVALHEGKFYHDERKPSIKQPDCFLVEFAEFRGYPAIPGRRADHHDYRLLEIQERPDA